MVVARGSADDASAREVINNLFFSEKRYDLGEVGRYRINKKLGLTTDMDCLLYTSFTPIVLSFPSKERCDRGGSDVENHWSEKQEASSCISERT